VRNLWVKYKDNSNWIIKDISFEAKEGELILIAGESGSGKSTLARAIAGLIPFLFPGTVKGFISVYGKNPLKNGVQSLAGLLSFVGQNPEMFISTLKVFDEIAFPLMNLGVPREEILRRIYEITELLGLRNLLDRLTPELSAGQLQRVALASALVTNPKILILDEPLARLDKKSAIFVASLLRRLADNGKIIIVFEHHLDEILPFSNRVIVIKDGRIIAEGKSLEIIKYLLDVDIPEISEAFVPLYKNKVVSKIPITVKEAVKLIDHAKERLV